MCIRDRIVALLHPFVILVFTALSSYIYVHHPDFVESEGGWLNNLGFHGLSEQLYEYTSCAANNGSGFAGLGDNTYFWNYTCGIVLILSRFIPIVGQVAIAGLLEMCIRDRRIGPGNFLTKTQGCAKLKDYVYSLTPARCWKVKRRCHRKRSIELKPQ